RLAGAGTVLAEEAAAGAVLSGVAAARPHHHEVTLGALGHCGGPLVVRGVAVHLELHAERRPGAREALAEDPAPRPILAPVVAAALPDDDEVAARVARDRRVDLVTRGVRVHLELGAEGRPRVGEAL